MQKRYCYWRFIQVFCSSPNFYQFYSSGAACNITTYPPPPPPKNCSNFSINCSTCATGAYANGLTCDWCPGDVLNASNYLNQGTCVPSSTCTTTTGVKQCSPPVTVTVSKTRGKEKGKEKRGKGKGESENCGSLFFSSTLVLTTVSTTVNAPTMQS